LADLNAFLAFTWPTLAHPTDDAATDPRASIVTNVNDAPDKDRIEPP
jgi:hypothetical protein